MIKPIRTEQDYEAALAEVAALMERDPDDGTEELDTLDVLVTLIQAYEAEHYPMAPVDPVDAIVARMQDLGLTQRQLAAACGISESRISEVLNRKRALNLALIRQLAEVLGLSIEMLAQVYDLDRAA